MAGAVERVCKATRREEQGMMIILYYSAALLEVPFTMPIILVFIAAIASIMHACVETVVPTVQKGRT